MDFINELQNFGKETSGRSERVRYPIFSTYSLTPCEEEQIAKLTSLSMRVAKGFCVTRDNSKINWVTRD